MANAKFSELVDPRLLEAAWHRYEAARALHKAREEARGARDRYERAYAAHQRCAEAYNTLEADIARGVRMSQRVAS